MIGPKGMWLFVALILSTSLFGEIKPDCRSLIHKAMDVTEDAKRIDALFNDDKILKTNMFSKYELAYNYRAVQLMEIFGLGELSVSSPFLPFCKNQNDSTSQASLNLNLPEEWGGLRLNGGITFQVENQQERMISSAQEHVVYFVSTKNLSDSKWKPFVSVSYIRSQVKDVSQARNSGSVRLLFNNYTGQARYKNAEVLGTCCGLKPFESLSMILSYNYLKPLHKGVRLSNHKTKVFDELKMASHNQNVDIRLDYAVRDGLNFLVKSEYLVPNGTLKDTVDSPVLIEGQLIVSF